MDKNDAKEPDRRRRGRDRRRNQITIFNERRLGDRRDRRLSLLNRIRVFLGLAPLD